VIGSNAPRITAFRLQFLVSDSAYMFFETENPSVLSLVSRDIEGDIPVRVSPLPYPADSFFHDEVFKSELPLSYGHVDSPNALNFKIRLPPLDPQPPLGIGKNREP
jgi:hypothetical protein